MAKRGKGRRISGGVQGSSVGSQMGAPSMGSMQTPARVAKIRKGGGRSMRGGRRR